MTCQYLPISGGIKSQDEEMPDYMPESESDEPVLAVMEEGFWKVPPENKT